MLKMILKDYRMTWKQGIANVYNNSGFFLYFYLLLYPAIVGKEYGFKQDSIYYVTILAYVFATLVSRMFPNRLEKTMYFCPMERKEREEYVRTAYWFRVLVAVVPLSILQLVMVVVGWIPLWSAAMVIITVFCHALNMNIYIVRKEKGTMEWFEGWNLGAQLLGMVSILAGVMLQMELTMGSVETSVIAVVAAVLVLFVWLTIYVVRKYRNTVFEAATDYERI